MTALFRLVHFVPDPFSGMRVPVAALVQEAGEVRVIRAPHTVGPECVGGLTTWHNMQGLIQGLEAVREFDRLPMSLGPHVLLDVQREVPARVEDAGAWVAKCVLPQRPLEPDDARETLPPSPRRESVGHAFFKTWHVDQYVHRHFKGETLGLPEGYAGTISHAVTGSDELLLMEPILGRPDLHEQLEEVSKSFLAWKRLLERTKSRLEPRFVAYLFSPMRTTVRDAKQFLHLAEAEIIDVDTPAERERFVDSIRRIGLTSPASAHLI